LTKREKEIIKHVLMGKTYPEIGKDLGIKKGTVMNHMQHIFIKLGMSNKTEVAIWAVKNASSETY
jgi:two-component system response regulator DegU